MNNNCVFSTMEAAPPSSHHTSPEIQSSSTFPHGHRRVPSQATTFASLFEDPWDRQCVLSLGKFSLLFAELVLNHEKMVAESGDIPAS
jgi:hypothetical protein